MRSDPGMKSGSGLKFLRRFFIRLSNFATGRFGDQRLRDEIAEHLAFQTEENLRAGMPFAEARSQAALKLGAAQAIRESHHAEQSLPLVENFFLDLRYAVRMLLKHPGFAIVAIATMALGVGATTAIYSVIDATLLHPLPYPNPAELEMIDAGPQAAHRGRAVGAARGVSLRSSRTCAIAGHRGDVDLNRAEP